MIETLRWLIGILCGVVWIALTGLVQPWLSEFGILLYTDAIFVIVPALLMPMRPAFVTVLLCALFADALRASPFGLSASILLPSLILLHFFQEKIYLWSRWTWVMFAAGINCVTWIIFAAVMFWIGGAGLTLPTTIKATLFGGGVSAVFILLLGYWFFAFQINAFKMVKKDLFVEMKRRLQ